MVLQQVIVADSFTVGQQFHNTFDWPLSRIELSSFQSSQCYISPGAELFYLRLVQLLCIHVGRTWGLILCPLGMHALN